MLQALDRLGAHEIAMAVPTREAGPANGQSSDGAAYTLRALCRQELVARGEGPVRDAWGYWLTTEGLAEARKAAPKPARLTVPAGALLVLQPGDLITLSWSGRLRTVTCDRIIPGGAVIRDLTDAEASALADLEAAPPDVDPPS
jgi:hypothetical protein